MKIYTLAEALEYMMHNRDVIMVRDDGGDKLFNGANYQVMISDVGQLLIQEKRFGVWKCITGNTFIIIPSNNFVLESDLPKEEVEEDDPFDPLDDINWGKRVYEQRDIKDIVNILVDRIRKLEERLI